MQLDPSEVYSALRRKNVRHLYHANTVQTSSTFLREGGLLSRAYVEARGLPQTPQYSDAGDKRFGIWDIIFLDTVDIHHRARRLNQYGPVLFKLPLSVLRDPEIGHVSISRRNPVHWKRGEPDAERYYGSVEEFEREFTFGDFYKHIMLPDAGGRLALEDGGLSQVILDDPQRSRGDGSYLEHARRALQEAATEGGVDLPLEIRECRPGCACVSGYSGLDAATMAQKFLP